MLIDILMRRAWRDNHQPMLRYLTISKFSEESGYTEDAIRAKIKNGVWLQDIVWTKAPDGRVLIDIEGFETWVQGKQVSALRRAAA